MYILSVTHNTLRLKYIDCDCYYYFLAMELSLLCVLLLRVKMNSGFSECNSVDPINMHDCDKNAKCTDTAYSYTCACNSGYNGSGWQCQGKLYSNDKIF